MCLKSRTETLMLTVMECVDHDWTKAEVDAVEALLEQKLAAAEELLVVLQDASTRMKRAQSILRDHGGEWHMLDTGQLDDAIASYEGADHVSELKY